MKNVRLAFLLLLTAAACIPDKKKDPEPELAGTYQVTQAASGNVTITFPYDGLAISVEVVRLGEKQLTLTWRATQNGQTIPPDPPTTVDINKNSSGTYDMLLSGTKVGTINGTELTYEETDSSGQRVIFTARKQ